ncbi:BTB/POZ domain protein [Rhizoctonia solani 123E]|uniref:BTB/POZ domain protein n=1 Tax=Rhizoctonia solani 123E TaxID=1423351 RepID=A0A074S475_9AGAM|nr:BTB/POZ domain protein [Rhizoctonia solani 123E]
MINNDYTSTNNPTNNSSGGKASAAKPHPNLKRHSEFFFDNTLVALQVEDTLFNVHKYQLLKSETFSDMFRVPKAEDDEPEEGNSPEHPIVMEGVKADDFVALLKVLYASHFSTHQPEPEASLIIPAFRLANMWNFSDLRAFLLPLAEKHLSDIDKILFAREFDIKDWLAPAHIRLCQRQEKITTEEAQKLGVNSLLLIARLGNQGSSKPRFTSGNYYCRSCIGFTYHGYNYSCSNCQGSSGCNAQFTCTGVGTPMVGNQSNPSIETDVNQWVDDGCVFKD